MCSSRQFIQVKSDLCIRKNKTDLKALDDDQSVLLYECGFMQAWRASCVVSASRPIKGFQNWTKWKWLTAIQTSQLLVCPFCHQSKQKHEYFFASAKTWAAFCALWATDPVTCPWARNRAENLLTPFKNSENYKLLRIIVTGQNKKITAQKKKEVCLMDCSVLVSTIKISGLKLTHCGQNIENGSWDWAKPPAVSFNKNKSVCLNRKLLIWVRNVCAAY